MKRIVKILFVAVAMIAYSVSANAQGSATTSGNAAARIIAPITLTAVNTLHFGTMFNNVGGTVTVPPTGARTSVGVNLSALAPTYSAGSFTVGGEAGFSYAITLPADGTVTISNGAVTMAINGFNHDAGATPAVPQTFNVGAVLTVAAGQASGLYTGTYSVTVAYN
ncbi:MAG: DUF4402 domain-containing protein [Bacteroidales bacterium]|jgi:hypothetical protein|nr:DUF4402 domain-containing protein [Bacteroidales bacterium]